MIRPISSKYVLTSKLLGVNTDNNTRVYKVNIWRVLKGDLNDVGVSDKFGTANALRFNDATVYVKSSNISYKQTENKNWAEAGSWCTVVEIGYRAFSADVEEHWNNGGGS